MTYARIIEELAYGWMTLSGVLNTHMIASNLIKRFGTEDHRQRGAEHRSCSRPKPDRQPD